MRQDRQQMGRPFRSFYGTEAYPFLTRVSVDRATSLPAKQEVHASIVHVRDVYVNLSDQLID